MTNSDKHPENSSTDLILAQLKDIASAVMYAAEASTVEQVLERIARVSQQLIHARYAALGVPDGHGGLRFFKIVGMTPEQVARLDHLPIGKGLIGAIMTDRSTLRLPQMADDPRSAGFCPAHPKMSSLLGVPIQVGQQLFGTLYLCDREDGQPFSEKDAWLIETLAGYAALAIAGSQLGEQQQRLSLLEERERIGMELHDGVIQSLYAIGMHLDLMRLSGEAEETETTNVLGNLNDVIEDIRRYIMNLQQSSDVSQKTVYERLDEVVKRQHTADTLKIYLNAPSEKPLFTQATFEAICQMVNEALSNAVRHSEAHTIHVNAQELDAHFEVVIIDDGKGFDLETLENNSGLGLHNVQQRAALHRGRVSIDSIPNEGTRLTIRVPVQIARGGNGK